MRNAPLAMLKPNALPVCGANIPAALADLPQWVLWRYEQIDQGYTKVPYRSTSQRASSTRRTDWLPFSGATDLYAAGGFDGIGFVVTDTDEFVGIDIDHATSIDGGSNDAVRALINQFGSYTEQTPGGSGFRIWIKGRKPPGARCRYNGSELHGAEIEIYESGRFFTVTGHRLDGAAHEILTGQAPLDAVCQAWWGRASDGRNTSPSTGDVSDEEILFRARNAANGEKFRSLFDEGDDSAYSGDTSRADMALCSMLAFWCRRDSEQIDRLFRQSKRMRQKWDDQRGQLTYGELTIKRAVESCEEVFTPSERPTSAAAEGADTEDACALEFSRRHPDVKYTPVFGEWHVCDSNSQLWVPDRKLLTNTLVRELVREVAPPKLHKSTAINGIVSLIKSNPHVATSPDDWDADPWKLGTPTGVVDLQTGEFVSNPKACYITRRTAVSVAPPRSATPVWDEFLERITRHDPDLVGYLQRIAGYALTGSDREQCAFFAHGPGGNGKGVFLNTLSWIMGDYACIAPGDLLLATNGDRHPTDLARLRGARLVSASELRPGAKWDEQRLKSLTGGDPITARHMRQDFFTFRPQLTLVIAANHRPSFSGVDEAIRRRLRLIPFSQAISPVERDPKLPDKLKFEGAGILRWMVDGCLAWQKDGLCAPASVSEASAGYLESEDLLGQWIEDRVTVHGPGSGEFTSGSNLLLDWQIWGHANGGPPWTAKAFYSALEERGFARTKRNGTRGFRGISLPGNTIAAAPGQDLCGARGAGRA